MRNRHLAVNGERSIILFYLIAIITMEYCFICYSLKQARSDLPPLISPDLYFAGSCESWKKSCSVRFCKAKSYRNQLGYICVYCPLCVFL